MFNPRGLYFERIGSSKEFKYVHFRKTINKIGRSPLADVYFNTKNAGTVSREHSIIEFKDDKMYISNLSKTNPTYLNNDLVIRQTEVEEGDLIGFGSKPFVTYQALNCDQIFVYECKSLNKSRQNVIILDDSDHEDVIEILDENENNIQCEKEIEKAPDPGTNNINIQNEIKSKKDPEKVLNDVNIECEMEIEKASDSGVDIKNERKIEKDPESKVNDINIQSEMEFKKLPETEVNDINTQCKMEIEKDSEVILNYINIHCDKEVEKDPDAKVNEVNLNLKNSPIRSIVVEHSNNKSIESDTSDESMTLHIDTVESINDFSSNECENSSDDVNKSDKCVNIQISLKKLTKDEFNEWKPKLNTNFPDIDNEFELVDTNIKTEEIVLNEDIHKSIEETVDPQIKTISEMRKKMRPLIDDDDSDDASTKNPPKKSKDVNKNNIKEPEPVNLKPAILKSSDSYSKYQNSTTGKDLSSLTEKSKIKDPKTSQKIFKFPEFNDINSNKSTNDGFNKKRRISLSEVKNDKDSVSKPTKKIFKRRMSLCSTSTKAIITQFNANKKNIPERRKSVNESRFAEIDMFSKASLLRMVKWGPTGRPSDVNPPKKQETINLPKNRADNIPVDKNISNQDIKNTIINRSDTKVNKENEESKKAALKIKCTSVTRGDCLTEEIPIKRTIGRRLSTTNDQQPSTSKDTMSVSTFYDKYVHLNDKGKESITEDVMKTLNEKINEEILKKHQQQAVEPAITVSEQLSPIESNSDNEELNLDTDDDDNDETLGFYKIIDQNEMLDNEIQSINYRSDYGSPMKDDPHGKTKWVLPQDDEDKNIEKMCEPTISFLTPTIHVYHEKEVTDVKKILKMPNFLSSSKQMKNSKKVSFNDYNLSNIVYYGINDCPSKTCEQKDDNNQPITSLVKNPKHYESAVCDELLEWDWKWMTSEKEIPHDFKVEPLKHTYSSLETYKNELKKILSMEILKKLCTKYKTIFAKDDVWNYMTVKDRKDGPNYHTKLDILCDFEEFKFGTLLLLKVMDMYHVSGKPTETSFFGYITSIDDKGDLKIDAYCTQLKRELSVLKYVTIMHIRSYIKLFAVLHCIQDTPLMKLFLNSNLNKIDRNEAMTSEMTAINLCPEQTKIVNKISYECTNDESEKIIFINGGAGTGKTYMMLATVINFKICLKDKRQYLICTSTSSELDEIVETLSNMPNSTSLNIVQFGYQEQITGRNRKYLFHELVQQKHNNSGKNYKEIQKEIILNADIILSTIKDCYELFDYQLSISACFIDNANFVVDTELMILLHLNIKKMIFIGDEYQLEPTHSHVYKETRCNNSYFNRIINYYKANNYVGAPVFTLLSQHRMNQDLFKLSNKHIYNNCMTCDSMSFTNYPFKSFSVFTLDINPNDQKLMDDEIDYFCEKLCEILPKNVSIGIVSGYKSQVDNLKVKLETVDKRIECLAVETIQGIEKDVIILTLRNTETNFMLGFNRINVAITRARKALYICSNMNMSFHPSEASVFLQLKDDARNRDLYQVIQKNDFDRLYSILRK